MSKSSEGSRADLTAIGLEMSTAELGDSRLSRRLSSLVEKVGTAPAKSLPALLTESELEGAYRFFSNGSVTPEAVLEPHIAATMSRIGEAGTALAIHDTTTMSFDPNGARRGLGRIKTAGQAFFAHFTIAVSAEGKRRPLGTLAMRSFVRNGKRIASEQDRWLDQMYVLAAARPDGGRGGGVNWPVRRRRSLRSPRAAGQRQAFAARGWRPRPGRRSGLHHWPWQTRRGCRAPQRLAYP